MKQLRSTLFVLAIAAVGTLSGCSLAKMIKMAAQQKLTVTPSPLEVHADSVSFEMSALLPVNMLRKGKVYTVAPSYKYRDQALKLKEVNFRFEDFPNAKTQQPQVKERFSFPYNPDYKRGDLVIVGIASDQNGKSKSTPELPLAKGVITTSKLVRDIYLASYVDRGYNNKEELEPTNVDFFFEQGKSVLRKSEIKGSSGKFLDAFIAARNVTRTVVITGMHSPEGTEAKNTKLSTDRPAEIEKYYRAQMKKFKQDSIAKVINFVIKPVVRDYTQFKVELAKNEKLTQDQKTEILAIVNDPAGSFEEKEMKIQKLASYNIVMKEVYPKVRVAKTEILTVKYKKPDATIIALSKAIADGTSSDTTLTDAELAFGAMNTPVLVDRAAIFKAATKKDDSWQSHNNLAATYIELAAKATDPNERTKYADLAATHVSISLKKQETPEALANYAAVMMMKREAYQTGLGNLKKAIDLNPDADVKARANAMKGVLEIKSGMYKNAINSLGAAPAGADVKYNQSLAYLLDKQFNQAKTGFNEVASQNSGDGWAAYLQAVTAARLGNESEVISNLKKAIAADSKIKEYALDDLEFMNYFASEGFKDALK